MNCPICFSSSTINVIKALNFPYFTVAQNIKRKKELIKKSIKRTDTLDIQSCNFCKHLFLSTPPDEKTLNELYSDYSSYPSPLKENFEPTRDNAFLNNFYQNFDKYSKENKLSKILEVGCFDGYILHNLKKRGYNVLGCDPSQGSEIGKEFGINIVRENFSPNIFLKKNMLFDIVISRHFIEHVVHPIEVIDAFKKVLTPNGVLILETPNVDFYLESGLMNVFSMEHLHAFSSNSMNYLLKKLEMGILRIDKPDDNLIVFARKNYDNLIKVKSNNHSIDEYKNKIGKNLHKISKIIKKYKKYKKIISLWGAGSAGSAAISHYKISPENIDYIIDSDPKKEGMEYLSNSIPIISPFKAIENEPDLIVIASMYSKTIQSTIIEKGFKSDILSLFPEISYIQKVKV